LTFGVVVVLHVPVDIAYVRELCLACACGSAIRVNPEVLVHRVHEEQDERQQTYDDQDV
jgi:hypothetical protein